MSKAQSRDRNRGSAAYLGMAATLFVASGGLLGGYFVVTQGAGGGAAEAPLDNEKKPAAGADVDAVQSAARALLEQEVEVAVSTSGLRMTWSELGVGIDEPAVSTAARVAEPGDVAGSLRARGAFPVTVDRARAAEALGRLKAAHDQPPRSARMDLEGRKIYESRDGVSLDVYASLAAIEAAARSGAERVELTAVAVPAPVTVADLGISDISHVLASFETKYAVNDSARNFNLKLAASKLNGYVLQPGVEFSFNDVVGARTEKEGYNIAGVIEAGEMVDGLAGGTCQISSTLHGAAFFAGLGIDKALPHSRPSTYVTMGLDATVVYPHVDLKLRNDYDFPVAIHFKVTGGVAKVEILGRERPYDKVVFEREIDEKLEFETVTREDDTMPIGAMTVDQYGFYGYKLAKIRKFYKDDKVVKQDKWAIRYAPVTEYVRMGSSPDPNLVAPKPTKKDAKKRLKEPDQETFRLAQ